jgi:SPP1 gp7 family putative phage head morphogenesis protein
MADYKDLTKEFLELREIIENLQSKKEEQMVEHYQTKLEAFRKNIRKLHDKYAVSGQLTFEEMARYNRINKLNKLINEEIRDLYSKNSNLITGILEETYQESFIGTKNIIEEATNRTIQGIVKNDLLEQAVNVPVDGLTLNQRLQRNRNNIIVDIQQTLQQGLKEGESYGQMSKRLKSSLEGDATKAKRIVRTEGHRVQEKSKLDSLDHAHNQGVDMIKDWVSSRDVRVRPSHRVMNSKDPIPYTQDFVNEKTGGKGPAPGQMGTAADDVNDRCIFIVKTKVE